MTKRPVLFGTHISTRPSAREWLDSCLARGLTVDTVRVYADTMEDFLTFWERHEAQTGPEAATRNDIVAYGYDLASRKPPQGKKARQRLDERGLAPATVERRLRSLHVYYRYLQERGERNDNPVETAFIIAARRGDLADHTARMVADEARYPWLPTDEEWARLLGVAARPTPRNAATMLRNQAMLRMAYDAALRREELINLRLVDVDTDARLVTVVANSTTGRVDRQVPISLATADLIVRYIATDRARAEQFFDDTLFLGFDAQNRGARLTPLRWSQILAALGKRADLPRLTTLTPRTLRLTHLARTGIAREDLIAFAGHENPRLVQIYYELAAASPR
jgi:integrase/recombinase XerD